MIIRRIEMPDEIYYKMVEYIDTDDHGEINDFILDVLIKLIKTMKKLKNSVMISIIHLLFYTEWKYLF